MSKLLKILFVEDSDDDARLLLREIQRAGYQVEFERVENADALRSALELRAWDLVLCDYSLPNFNAPAALSVLQAGGHDLPFIVVSGTIGEDTAVEALKAGAHDFIVKGSLARLLPAVERELREAENRRKKKEADDALRESNARFLSLFENSPVSIWEEDFSQVKDYLDALKLEAGSDDLESFINEHPQVITDCLALVKVIDVNQATLKLFGANNKDELLGRFDLTFEPETLATFTQELLAISQGIQQLELDVAIRALDGQHRDAKLSWAVAPDHEKTYSRLLVSFVDITDRKRHERELEAIASVSKVLRTVKTFNELLSRLLDESIKLVKADAGSIWLYNPATDLISLETHKNWGNETIQPIRRGHGIPGLVVQKGKAIVSREFSSDLNIEDHNPNILPAGIGGVCIPLHAAETVVGAMFVNVRLPRELTTDEIRIINTLTEIGGNAIHRMRLLDQSIRQIEHLNSLRTIDLAISNSLDLRLSLSTVLEQVVSQLEVDAACVLLMRAETNRLEYSTGRGFRTRTIASTSLRLGEGYAGQAMLDKKIIHIKDLRLEDENFVRRELLADEEFVTYFGVPLIAKGEVKGVLEIFNRTPLHVDMDWLDFLDSLSWQTAIAIDNALLFEKIQRSNFDLERAYDATIEGWSHALDLRDKETEGHTQRVTEMTIKLARLMGINDAQLVNVRRGSLLHDIGKMGVPDSILLKPGPLTEEEWQVMHNHPQLALELLTPISYLQEALDIPYCHHEKWDGSGYPRSLAAGQIPLAARIFAIVDVWDALTSDRPYRPKWEDSKALDYIRENSGTHFDPQVVETFLNNFQTLTQN